MTIPAQNRTEETAAGRIAHSRPTLGPEDERAVCEVVASGVLVRGPRLAAFEAELAARLGRDQTLAVSSGSAALHLALRAMNVGPGDEAAIPSYGCVSLLQAVRRAGVAPLLIDCDPATFQLDPDHLRRRRTPATKAVIHVHTFGVPAPVQPVAAAGLPVIEDVATALGAHLHGQPAGSEGCFAVCSFNATKMITTGGGGALAADDPALMNRAADLVDYDGRDDPGVRYNERMGELAASLGLSQLARLAGFVERRRAIARVYLAELAGAPVQLPREEPGTGAAWHRFVIRIPGGASPVRSALAAREIDSPPPVHRPLHRILGQDGFPGADTAQKEALSLPIYPSLTTEDARRVAREVGRCLASR